MNKERKKLIIISTLTLLSIVAAFLPATLTFGHGYWLLPIRMSEVMRDFFSEYLNYIPFGFIAIIGGLLLWGLIAFVGRKNISVRLLRFVYAVILIFNLFGLIFAFFQFVHPVKHFVLSGPAPTVSEYKVILIFLSHVFWIILSATVLQELRNATRPIISVSQIGEHRIEELIPATKLQRFIHSLIDGTVFLAVIISIVDELVSLIQSMAGDMLSLRLAEIIILLILRLMYYLVFEGVWASTPGKMITGTTVLDDDGAKPYVWGRSLARFIPFDAWSFFGWRGWHDELSHTGVYKEEIKDEKTDPTVV